MIKVIGFTVLLILFLRIVAVSSGAVESCSPVLDAARTKPGNLTCDAIKSFAQCVLNGISNGDATLSAKERIAEMEALSKIIGKLSPELRNITCVTDYQTKIKELADDTKKRRALGTGNQMQIISSADIEKCAVSIALKLELGCRGGKILAKCAMRVAGLTDPAKMTNESIDAVQEQVDDKLASIGLECDFDYRALAEEMRNEKGSIDDVIPKEVLDHCITDILLNLGSQCEAARSAGKCAMKEAGYTDSDKLNDGKLAHMKKEVDEKLAKFGIKCDLDYRKLLEEMLSALGGALQLRGRLFHLIGIVAISGVFYFI